MLRDTLLRAQLLELTPGWERLLSIVGGFVLFAVLLALFLLPLLIWRARVRRRGYPGLRVYLHMLPQSEEEQLDAVELTLKGAVLCILGLLFPPLILLGVVPLYYGARKLAAMRVGIGGTGENRQHDRSQ
jgi:hypothetical protein